MIPDRPGWWRARLINVSGWVVVEVCHEVYRDQTMAKYGHSWYGFDQVEEWGEHVWMPGDSA